MSSPTENPRSLIRGLVAGAALLVAAAVTALAGCSQTYEFESFSVGDSAVSAAAKPLANSQFVRGAYVDTIGRTPDVHDYSIQDAQGKELYSFPIDEQAVLVKSLDSIGDPAPMRALVCAGLLGSAEVSVPEKAEVEDPAAFIRDQFRALLGREPNAYEARAFEDAWRTDEAVGPRAVIRAITGSREYQSR